MCNYKVFFYDDGEFFEYDTYGGQGSSTTRKAFPYLEGLLSFLEMDHEEWEALMHRVSKNSDQFFTTNDLVYTDQVMQLLGELGESIFISNYCICNGLNVKPEET